MTLNINYIQRYKIVCHARALIGKEKQLGNKILKFSIYTPLVLGLLAFYYRENTIQFLFCMGKMEQFYFDLRFPVSKQIGGAGVTLEFFNPFRLSVNILGYSFFFIVPTLYYKIFRFRRIQDTSVLGMNIYMQS